MGLLDHQELAIIKGIGKLAGDTLSNEADPVVLDLLSSSSAFSLAEWSPNIPSLKSGGVWADSPISDGRILIAGANTNVTETMVINLTGSTIQDYAAQFIKLQKMVQDARGQWDLFYQIEPVFLKWWLNGEKAPKYALIYNIDMDVEFQDGPLSQARITLTIERDLRWSPLEPGANPKEWTLGLANTRITSSNSRLDTAPFFATAVISNCTEWLNLTTPSAVNYIDIPGTNIPGDLPALVMLQAIQGATHPHGSILVGRSTKPTTLLTHVGGLNYQFSDLIAAASIVQIDTALAADTGAALYTTSSVNRQRAETSFATVATDAPRATWGGSSLIPNISVNTLRGRYMMFIRARQSNGTFGQLFMSVRVLAGGVAAFTSAEQSPTVSSGAGNTTDWPVHYMGVLDIPLMNKAVNGFDGRGLFSPDPALSFSPSDIQISFYARRTAGVGVLYFCDLMLIPIDECAIRMSNSDASGQYGFIYDGTRHFSHGFANDGAFVQTTVTPALRLPAGTDLSGDGLTLMPGVNNRLYFLQTSPPPTATSRTQTTMTVNVHIIPQWSGIRGDT